MAKKKKKKKTKKKKKNVRYEAEDIDVLEGLDPVRKRPAMYIGSTGSQGLHHLIWECLDNAIDEAIAGFASEATIELLPDNKVRVTDNGRGIPVTKHPQTKKSALETVMTTLHAGAKFSKKSYQVSGGLHGVGVSVVCALSTYTKAEVCRDGTRYTQEYKKGEATTKIKKTKNSCSHNGTTITFSPDGGIFKTTTFRWKKIVSHLRQQAYLTKGFKITLKDRRKNKEEKDYTFYFEGGIKSYIRYLIGNNKVRHPDIFYLSEEKDDVQVEVALQYTDDVETLEESFANNIYTPSGGTHVSGFKTALTRTLNKYARDKDFLKDSDNNLSGTAIREGLTSVVSVKVKEPQFEGQTKAKLGNSEVKGIVQKVFATHFEDFLERNPKQARAILEGVMVAAKARRAAKKARETVLKKKTSLGLSLPGKLADCSSRKPEKSELFIVEGESAGGSAKQARDREFQAILPLKGKILNVEKAQLNRILSNKEIKNLIVALGTAIAEDFDLSKLRYHKIIIMADADVDGQHIVTLLLTLFYRYFKPIIEKGYLYVAQPPLYKITKGKKVRYVYTEKESKKVLKSMKGSPNIQRFKGLGEMNPKQLWETTMKPEQRILKRVTIEESVEADQVFDNLMGKQVSPRKKFIQSRAKEVQHLDV